MVNFMLCVFYNKKKLQEKKKKCLQLCNHHSDQDIGYSLSTTDPHAPPDYIPSS